MKFVYDITLVAMPFLLPESAPLGIGVLTGALRRADRRVRVIHANIDMAERIPDDLYQYGAGATLNADLLLADYLFADLLFGASPQRDLEFTRLLRRESEQERILWSPGVSSLEALLGAIPFLKRECARVVDRTVAAIVAEPSRIVAVSSTFFQRFAALALLTEIRKRLPEAITFIGGADCEGLPGLSTVASFDCVDYLFSGEGDALTPEMVGRVLSGQAATQPLPYGVYDRAKSVRALAQSVPEAEVCIVPPEEIANPDQSDFYARFARSRFARKPFGKYYYESSRGCWKGSRAQCTFCGLNGARLPYRRRAPEVVQHELLNAATEYRARMFFAADTVLDPMAMRSVLSEVSARVPDAVFTYETVSTLNEPWLRFLADCGVLILQPGIESLHPRHLELLNKSNRAIGNIAFLKYCRENRILVLWNLLTSMPGDRPEEYAELAVLLPKLTHLPGPFWGGIRFDRFSAYHTHPERYGLKLVPAEAYGILVPPGRVKLEDWAFFFDNRNRGVSVEQSELAELRSMVRAWRRKAEYFQCVLALSDDGRIVHDTRPQRPGAEYTTLSEAEAALLEWTHEPRVRTSLLTDHPEWTAAAESLQAKAFLLEWDGHFLALPTRPLSPERRDRLKPRYRTMRLMGDIPQAGSELDPALVVIKTEG